MKRRDAVKTTLLGLGSLGVGGPLLQQLNTLGNENGEAMKVGIQLFTIPKMVDADFRGTLARLSEIGYREIEFFGPYPASADAAKAGFGMMQRMLGLERHAFYGLSEKETAALLKEFELEAPSMHVNLATLRDGLPRLLESLAVIGTKYVVLPAIIDPSERSSLEDYRRLANEFNRFGQVAKEYGVKFMYHNHGYEHQEMDGSIPLDFLISNTDPELVDFELDIFWMAAAGAKPVDYLNKYQGRFKALHIKDASETFRFATNGDSPQEWMAGFPKMADPGTGVFDIEGIVSAARKSGVEHFFLERDLTPMPDVTLQNSFAYLSKL